ncbi:hypothetical protein [Desulfovibrio aminophilus]|uniref:hypothetical protein n=1 Tax=Desulfovibrio aminophilus TaxID=81425 RepID=UPI00040EF545|nr:hypothetical protein [Desulfovibrio aminophilus]
MADRKTPMRDGESLVLGVAASTLLEAGKMAALNAAGYVVPASNTAGLKILGRTEQRVDNTGGQNGDRSVEIRRKKLFKFKNSGTSAVTVANIGGNVMVEDAETVAVAASNSIVAGKCLGVEPDGVWIEFA